MPLQVQSVPHLHSQHLVIKRVHHLLHHIVAGSTTDAEIRSTLKNVLSSFSYRSCDGLSDLFSSMFPDSEIAQKFSLGKDKCGYYINYRFAPYFRSILAKNLKDSDFFSVSFDESLNSVLQMGQMDVVVSFWDNTLNRVCARYLNSTFVGHARHTDLLKHFRSTLEHLGMSKLLQVAMDGPAVNWAFYTELCKDKS